MSDSTNEAMGYVGDCAECGKPIMVWEDYLSADGAFDWVHTECKRDDEALYEQGVGDA